jgi:hypothetical protein
MTTIDDGNDGNNGNDINDSLAPPKNTSIKQNKDKR